MRVRFAVVAAVAALWAGCGGGDSGFTNATEATQTLVGTWLASRAEYTNRGNSSQKLDIVAHGSVVTLVLEAGSTFRLTIVDPGEPGNTVTGTWSASRDVLTIVQTGQSGQTQFDMTFSGNTLALENGHVLFDIDGDDVGEECELDMTLARQ
jgi:hypothetical protein